MSPDQKPDLSWRGNVPVSNVFNDPYFSLDNGLAETRYVFLDGNDLPNRFEPGFHVAELGFGTGLNCLATLALWRASSVAGPIRYTSFELYPMAAEDMELALTAFPELMDTAAPIIEARRGGKLSIISADLHLEIIPGDARVTLPDWPGMAHAWFLDGFSHAGGDVGGD